MHIQTDLIEQQCETSGPTDYFTISSVLLSQHTFCAGCHVAHFMTVGIVVTVVVIIRPEGLADCFCGPGPSPRLNLERKVRMESPC